jgi:hypothetical protein
VAGEVSLDAEARKRQEALAAIRSDHLINYSLTHIKVQATINETRSEIEATRREFHILLEVVKVRAKHGRGTGVCANVAQLPTFEPGLCSDVSSKP